MLLTHPQTTRVVICPVVSWPTLSTHSTSPVRQKLSPRCACQTQLPISISLTGSTVTVYMCQSWGKWSALRPRVRFMDSEAGAKQALNSFRCVNSDHQATLALPSLPTMITNADPLRLSVQANMDAAAKLVQGRMLARRASRLRWHWCRRYVFPCPLVACMFIDI